MEIRNKIILTGMIAILIAFLFLFLTLPSAVNFDTQKSISQVDKHGTKILTRCEDKIVCVYSSYSFDINRCFRDDDLIEKYCE